MLHILGENGDSPQVSAEKLPDGTFRIVITGTGGFLCLPGGQDPSPEYDSTGPRRCPYCKKEL
jgi:hypothetical protein